MSLRHPIGLIVCLCALTGIVKGEQLSSAGRKGTVCFENTIELENATSPAANVVSDTAAKPKPPEPPPPPKAAVEPQKGFIKMLFAGATKEEKAAKKEAKALKELKNLQTKVYGWYPYWMSNAVSDLNYNLITTLSYYSVDMYLDPDDGQVSLMDNGIDSYANKAVFSKASRAGCRIDVTFSCKDSKTINQILNNPEVQDTCISRLVNKMNTNYLFDGVCIVFENMPPNNSGSLVLFMSALREALNKPKRSLKLALPPKDYSNNYDILHLNTVVESYILMGYNYYPDGTVPGPEAPLDDKKKNLSIKTSVRDYLNKGTPFNKLIVALPYYGSVWKRKNSLSDDYTMYKRWTYSQVVNNIALLKPQIEFDSVSYTSYYNFELKDGSYRCYFDNDESLAKKYKWAIKQGVGGIGIWALGYDHGSQDFWEMIGRNFMVEKLNPFKKEIVVNQTTRVDTVFSYLLIGDSLVKHTSLVKDTMIRDTLFGQILNPDIDTTAVKPEKAWLSRELGKLKLLFGPLLSNKKVAAAVLITLIVFGLIGILSSLLFASVREQVYITSLPVYILTNAALILAGVAFFAFLSLLRPDLEDLMPGLYRHICNWLWVVLVFSWVLINLLSYKLIGVLSFKSDKP